MVERAETLLDLSDWPAAPVRTGLPPRPSRGARPRLPRLRLTDPRAALGCLGVGVVLLLLPLGSCGPALAAWAASPQPAPTDVPPALDDAETRSDAAAVAAAKAALAAWHPAASATGTPSGTRTTTVSAVNAREVAADQDAVAAADADATSAQRELDDLLAEQEASADPGQYDGQVAAAREELDRAVAALDDARRALAEAKARTRTVTVTTTASPRPAATGAPAPSSRAELAARFTEANQVQAAHLAQRARAVADWRAGHEQQVRRVSAHNAAVRSCAGRAAVPASGGAGLVVLGGGLLLRRRVTRLRAPR